MEKKRNQKGFTLAELLIVVAIIAVLVAIAIPVFTSRLEQSRETTDLANLRSAYAAGQVAALSGIGDVTTSQLKSGTWYFNPDSEFGLDSTGVAIGQGTATDGKIDTSQKPSVITWNSGDVRQKKIRVIFGDSGLQEVKFE